MTKKALILGGGFSGCTVAHLLLREGWECTIVEREEALGGGCQTLFYGGHPYTNGPRVYYGYSEKVYRWISSVLDMQLFTSHELWSYVEAERKFFSYPIHEDDIPHMSEAERIYDELKYVDLEKKCSDFEEYWVSRIGTTLYDMFVNEYSKKMWMIPSNKELDTFSWSAKDNPINSGARGVYKSAYLGYPIGYTGYNPYFDKTADGSTVLFKRTVVRTDLDKKEVVLDDGTRLTGNIIVSSIPVEELCNHSSGDLPYVGRTFIPFVLPVERILPENVRFLHYTQAEPYTRIVEYKTLTGYEAPDTLLVMEIPSREGKLYPYMIKEYIDRAKDYQRSLPENIYSTGRLGTYKYSTIEQTIAQAFSVFRKITGRSVDGLEEEFYDIGDLSLIKDRRQAS